MRLFSVGVDDQVELLLSFFFFLDRVIDLAEDLEALFATGVDLADAETADEEFGAFSAAT